MATFYSNPAYIMPAVILGAVLIYYAYAAFDKGGLETHDAIAVVTEKTHTPGSTNYVNRVAAGRSWTQAQQLPDYYAISLSIEGEPTVALVTKEKFAWLSKGERVRVKYSRTRISNQLLIVEFK